MWTALQGLFSATLTSDVKQLVGAGLRNPVTVTVREPGQAAASFATPTSLHNYYLVRWRARARGEGD